MSKTDNPVKVNEEITVESAEAMPEAAIEKKPVDPWKTWKQIFLPRGQKTEENFLFVGVNGRTYQVPKGKSTMVPLPVYEVIMNMQEQLEAAYAAEEEGNQINEM